MKKRIIPLLLVLILSLALCIPASAVSYIPDDVTYQNLNGTQFAIKVFTLLPDQNPAELIEDDFEYGGYLYSYADIVKEELTFSTQSQHQEIVTVETATKNLEDILAALESTIDFDDGNAKGIQTDIPKLTGAPRDKRLMPFIGTGVQDTPQKRNGHRFP